MFQNQVYINPAQGLPGDFASSNPMVYKLSSTGKMVADASGVKVGQFCVLNADGTVTSVPGAAPTGGLSRVGFVPARTTRRSSRIWPNRATRSSRASRLQRSARVISSSTLTQ
jgi:hypothetical protein